LKGLGLVPEKPKDFTFIKKVPGRNSAPEERKKDFINMQETSFFT
jgi:hypothetical protein